MAKGEPTLLVATMSFHFTLPDGQPIVIRRGQTYVYSDHPAAKAEPGYWKPFDPTYATPGPGYRSEPIIEQATAAPGQKRGAA